jgi:hypothetical protein
MGKDQFAEMPWNAIEGLDSVDGRGDNDGRHFAKRPQTALMLVGDN